MVADDIDEPEAPATPLVSVASTAVATPVPISLPSNSSVAANVPTQVVFSREQMKAISQMVTDAVRNDRQFQKELAADDQASSISLKKCDDDCCSRGNGLRSKGRKGW